LFHKPICAEGILIALRDIVCGCGGGNLSLQACTGSPEKKQEKFWTFELLYISQISRQMNTLV
jgi:hypothetical protein